MTDLKSVTEDKLKSFCGEVINNCDMQDLGALIFLIDENSIMSINHFPKWSVLQFDNAEEKIVLSKIKETEPEAWFEKCDNTLGFLQALSERCDEMSKTCSVLKEALQSAVEESFGNIESKPTIH